jgi:hypothetical protein
VEFNKKKVIVKMSYNGLKPKKSLQVVCTSMKINK